MQSLEGLISRSLLRHESGTAALRFLKKAIRQHGLPEKITIDKSEANTAAIKA